MENLSRSRAINSKIRPIEITTHPPKTRIPVNWPIRSKAIGMIKKAAFCCDSSIVVDFAEPLTIKTIEIMVIAGTMRSITHSQLIINT